MRKNLKLISFILSIVMILQALNLSFAWADTESSTVNDDVVSGSGIIANDYSISTFAMSSEQNSEDTLQDIVLVLDDSGSMSSSEMRILREASVKFCETILEANSNNRIGIVAFAKSIRYDFSNDIEELTTNINSLYGSGGTPLDRGIVTADNIFAESWNDSSVKSIVIMSDGEPDNDTTAKAAYDNVADKYNIYSVYFGNNSSARTFMESIQNSGFFYAEDVDSLIEQFTKIADVILNPLEVVITHECIYNFLAQEYVVKAVINNPNNKAVENIQLNLELPQNVELSDGESASKTIQTLEGKTSQEITWNIGIMQEQENKTYNIIIQVNASDLISMNVEHQIFVDGYYNGDLRLDISKDTWSFENYGSDGLNIDDVTFEGLLQTLDDNTLKENLKDAVKVMGKGGHCYGMSVTAILAKAGETSAGQISSGAECIHDIALEDADETISYYQLTQRLPGINEELFSLSEKTIEQQLEDIANKARLVSISGTPVLLILRFKDGGLHAVVCYDYQHIDESVDFSNIDENSYNSCLLIYDSNFPDTETRIFFNSTVSEGTNAVTVNDSNYLYFAYGTHYDSFGIKYNGWYTPYNIESFVGAVNDVSIINLKDIENMSKNYSAWLRVKLSQDMKRLQVYNNYVDFGISENGVSDDNTSGFFDIADVNSSEKYYNVKLDNDENYNITAEYLTEFDISLMYLNYYLAVKADNAKGINFDHDGSVQLKDNVSGYSLKLTANDGYTSLPWYTVTVEGEKAENPSLQITDEGYLFEGEELSNIKVTANNDKETKELIFNSDKTSVLITNDDDNLIVKEDSDNDGVYDKVIADSNNTVIEETESTTKDETETTTRRVSSGGSSGAGASSLKVINYDETTTEEASTEITTEDETEKESVGFSQVKVTIGSNIITIDDNEYEMDAIPYIQSESNSTMVPLRFVALAIGGGNIEKADESTVVNWDAVTKTATIIANGNSINFTAGSNLMTVNGVSGTMDYGVKAEIKDGRMYIPFRALGEAMGVDVEWDAETRTAIYRIK